MIVLLSTSAFAAKSDILKGVKRMMFIGDSLTDGSDYPDYVVNTINRERPRAQIQVQNAALCGDTAAGLVRRLDRDILSQRPDLVSICIGTNDCGRTPIADYARDLEFLVFRIKDSGAKVLLMIPTPLGNPEYSKALQDNIAVIRALAKKYDCPVADAHTLGLQWMKEGKAVLGADGCHHGDFGFECMARAVLIALGYADAPMNKKVSAWPYQLTEWEMSRAFLVEQMPGDARGITKWQPYDRMKMATELPWWDAPFAARGGFLPFKERPAKPTVVFGRTWYNAKADTAAEMQIGADARKVWVNGVQVWEQPPTGPGGWHPNVTRFPITLKKGRNEIVTYTSYFNFVGIRELKP